MDKCILCGKQASEHHHIIKRSASKSLINCSKNIADLCVECHRGTNGVHGKDGHGTDNKLKTMYFSKMSRLFHKPVYTKKEIQEILEINNKDTDRLIKTVVDLNGRVQRDKLLLALMGFKIDVEVTEL